MASWRGDKRALTVAGLTRDEQTRLGDCRLSFGRRPARTDGAVGDGAADVAHKVGAPRPLGDRLNPDVMAHEGNDAA